MILDMNPKTRNRDKKRYCGIYSINFENGKRYIGLSVDIGRRYYEHNYAAEHNDLLPVHAAMRKYNFVLELLEDCSNINNLELQEKEKYWIAYYDTYKNPDKGYNLTPGGEGIPGCDNPSAKLSEVQIQEVYDLLINHKEFYIYQIAEKFNISPDAISEINNGRRYYNEFLTYPLRNDHWMPEAKYGLENHLAIIKEEEQLNNIYNDLQNSSLTLREIAKKYNVCYSTISNINRGLRYIKDNFEYPIRKEKRNLKLSYDQIQEIYILLINTTQSLKAIGKQYNVSQDTIIRLNKGETYKKEGYTYPIRANKEINKAVSTISGSGE